MKPKELIRLLRKHRNEELLRTCLNWLKENFTDDLAEDVFEAAIGSISDEKVIKWSIDWFTTDHQAAIELLPTLIRNVAPEHKKRLMDLGCQIVFENSEADSDTAYLASQLIEIDSRKNLVVWAENWLANHKDLPSGPVLMRSLLLDAPADEHISQASEWCLRNSSHWYTSVMLSTLLSTAPGADLIAAALTRIRLGQDNDYELILLVHPLLRADATTAEKLADWIGQNTSHSLSGDILMECLNESPEAFIRAAACWLEANRKSEQAILIENEVKNWASANPTHPEIQRLFPPS